MSIKVEINKLKKKDYLQAIIGGIGTGFVIYSIGVIGFIGVYSLIWANNISYVKKK